MTVEIGRPRDPRIDSAVLDATVELLAETGYAALSVDAIARRAGTSKPAIYRRWPSKAHLVHEAVFPISDATELPETGTVLGDVREMMRRTVDVLTTPPARAALPGLVGETAADPTLHAALLERFAHVLSRGLTEWLESALARGGVRAGVNAADVVDAIAGITFVALITHGDTMDDAWLERTAELITRGISRMTEHESTAAWRELLDTLGGLDRTFLEGDRAVTDDRHIADGYRMLATTLGVALDTYLFAEPSRPVWIELNTPYRRDRRWGGDNTDAYYFMCPVDPARRYRISGNRGDSVYFSVTAYNEPSPGAWSDKVVAIVRDDDLDIDADGNFSFELGPTDDGVVLVTRDYQADPLTGRPVSWNIEALDEPESVRHGDAETAAALRSSAAWLRTMFAIVPLAVGVRVEDAHTLGHEISQAANQFADPYQVPDANFGWSARDACYAYGSFVLDEDEALVVTHRPPSCRFWNLVVWNQFMAAHNGGDARCSINGHSAVPNADGSVTVVISGRITEHPNSITTLDYPRGNLAFRWFLADEVPARPEVHLVKVSDAPTSVS